MKIFVYGTLRKGMRNYNTYLLGRVSSHQEAYVRGKLYSIKGKDYPALVEGNDLILGEILDIDDDQNLLQELDKMEGYNGEGNLSNEYNRQLMSIVDQNENFLGNYFVYCYNMDNPTQKDLLDEVIEENDYCHYLEKMGTVS
ncbi:MAG: gamma-glutamylcyclotransferase [Anaerorhabdus sp.]